MFYSNGNYMQDFNCYNQNPNINYYNPYLQNGFPNPNMMQQNQAQNLNMMYPAIYRIILPVVTQVLQNTNIGYLTEEALNNYVDTVYNIVEGDITLPEESNNTQEQMSSSNRNNSSSTTSSAINVNSSNRQNNLLRDIIKIIMLNEIRFKRQNFMQNMNNNQMWMNF